MELHAMCQHILNVRGAVWRRTWHTMSGKHKHGTACDVPAHFKCARCCVAQDLAPNEWETHSMSGKHKHETACNLSARIKCVRCCVAQDLAPNEWETQDGAACNLSAHVDCARCCE